MKLVFQPTLFDMRGMLGEQLYVDFIWMWRESEQKALSQERRANWAAKLSDRKTDDTGSLAIARPELRAVPAALAQSRTMNPRPSQTLRHFPPRERIPRAWEHEERRSPSGSRICNVTGRRLRGVAPQPDDLRIAQRIANNSSASESQNSSQISACTASKRAALYRCKAARSRRELDREILITEPHVASASERMRRLCVY